LGRTAVGGTAAFCAERSFRSPIRIPVEPNTLYSGIPIEPQIPWVRRAQVGDGVARSSSAADGLRLGVELQLREANILDAQGRLTSQALSNVERIIDGKKIGNPAVISELTKDGSNIQDWAKFTTRDPIKLSNGQKFQIHFYMNEITYEVNLNIDYKLTPLVQPFRP
jgi:hypothetical protein